MMNFIEALTFNGIWYLECSTAQYLRTFTQLTSLLKSPLRDPVAPLLPLLAFHMLLRLELRLM